MKKALSIIMLSIIGIYGTANAQKTEVITSDKTGWHKIGETTVDFKKDRDEVKVMGAVRFASIRFKVQETAIELISLEVYYESGEKQDVRINETLKAKGESRTIDLNGGERSLKSIIFVYKTIPNSKDIKAHVEIWGLKTNTDKK